MLPIVFNGHYHFYLYRGLRRALRGIGPDLIHIDEEPYNPAGAQAQWVAQRMRVPTVFVTWQNLYRAYPPPFAWLERHDYHQMAHLIAGNAGAGEVARRKGYTGPLSVFSVHGIDPDLYRPLPRRECATDDGACVIGYLGRLVLYKGTGLLIEALAGLPEHCRLRLIGAGPDEAALRRLAEEKRVANRVGFCPALATGEVPQALAELDVLAAPSLTQPNWAEQFGRVLIEAMACGVPVVGSNSGEIPQVIGDAGIITPEGDVAALREALLALATNPTRRTELAQRGRARALERFTQEQVARKIAEVYRLACG